MKRDRDLEDVDVLEAELEYYRELAKPLVENLKDLQESIKRLESELKALK